MNAAIRFAILSLIIPATVPAGQRFSANYGITADVVDSGGRKTSSANYANQFSLGGLGGVSSASGSYAVKPGFENQTFEVLSFAVSATPTNVNEGATRQLTGTATLDDSTVLIVSPPAVSWSVLSGPITSINTNGLSTAGLVYQNTPATVRGDYQQQSGTLGLLVLNVDPDNFGLYAGDGVPDDWQVQYFGETNPSGVSGVDPDGDGQVNGYEYVVGTVPTNAASHFSFAISNTVTPATYKILTFSQRFTNRTYAVQFSTNLSGAFGALTTSTQSDNGTIRTVTDTNAVSDRKFYRVQVAFP